MAMLPDAAAADARVAAGGAAGVEPYDPALPGVVAAHTDLPVIGVPVPLARLDGLDSLLSIVQMPAGIPVGTLAIGKPGEPLPWINWAANQTCHPAVRAAPASEAELIDDDSGHDTGPR
mgnify:CR=1 FL=1